MADAVMFGPISFLAVATDDMNLQTKRGVKEELKKLRDAGTIRVLDAVYAQRDQFGSVTTKAASDLTHDDRVKLGVVIGSLVGLGAAGDEGAIVGGLAGGLAADEAKKGQGIFGLGQMRDAVRDMVPEGAAILVLLIEHLWAKDLKQSLVDANCQLLSNIWVTPDMFIQAGMEMAEMAELAAELDESDFYTYTVEELDA